MRIGKDIFEDVKKAIGCDYISDIPKRQEEVIETIRGEREDHRADADERA